MRTAMRSRSWSRTTSALPTRAYASAFEPVRSSASFTRARAETRRDDDMRRRALTVVTCGLTDSFETRVKETTGEGARNACACACACVCVCVCVCV